MCVEHRLKLAIPEYSNMWPVRHVVGRHVLEVAYSQVKVDRELHLSMQNEGIHI